MNVLVNGEKVEIAVSEGGIFHDVATKTHSAPTLRGLTKKLRENARPKNGIQVESNRTGKRGVVTSRHPRRSWRGYFRVTWADTTVTDESSGTLMKPLTPEEKKKLAEIQAEIKEREAANKITKHSLDQARQKEYLYLQKFSMSEFLESAFPR